MKVNLFLMIMVLISSYEGSTLNSDGINVDGVPVGFRNLRYVGEIERVYDNKEGENSCEDWTLTRANFENLLQNLDPVEGVEWGALCYNYPCYYRGEVCDEKGKYDIEINAGSYVVLKHDNKLLYFIAKNKLPFFIIECNCCED